MVFVYFATVAVIVILCAVFLGRLFAWIVQLVARYACRLDLRVESFGFLTIKGIKVKLKGGRTIEIERVALHTKWDLPNSKKLFTIFLENVLLSVERRENQPSRRTPSNSQSNFVMTHKDTISSFLQTFCKVSSLQSTLTIPKAVAQLSKVIQVRLKTVGLLLSDGLLRVLKSIFPMGLFAALLTSQAAKVKVPDTVPAEENNDVSGDRQDLQMLLAKVLKAPKHVEVVLETSSITLLNQEKRKLTAELGRIITTFSKGHSDLVSNCDLNVGVSGVTLSGTEPCKLCTLNRLRFCLKLSKRDDQMQMVSSLSIESFHNNYVHEECIYWLEYFKSRRKNVSPPRGGGQPVKSLPQLHLSSPVSVDIEMVDCSTSLYLKAPSRTNQPLFRAVLATCSIGGTLPNKDSEKAQSASVTMRLENAYVYVDAVKSTSETRSDVQSVSYTLTDNPGLLPSTHRHVWGRVLALGSCSIKVCRTLVQVTSRFVPHGLQRQKDQEEGGTGKPPNVMIHTELRISAINVFYLGTQLDGIDSFVMRSDMVTIATHTGAATHIDICGVKVARMIGLQKAPYRCLQSAELEGHCLSVPFLSLSMDKNKQPLSVSVSDVEVEWNPTFHMALNDRIQELTEDAKTFKELVRSSSSNSVPKPSGSSKTRALLCELASFKLCMKTSPSTSFGVEVSRSTLDVQDDSVLVTMTTASVLFDDQPIFMFEDVSLNKVADALAHTRQQFKSLETSTNHAWIVSSRDTHVLFPFEYDFATSRSELVNVTKMLKALHKKPRGYDHVESLPPDLWLKFEVSLYGISIQVVLMKKT
ncbi:predicted protein [Nematostella vectensis]|uniref:Uncharacterized protein n=1 Tax=Nematostella vectensis TaxID=45351 RepID=A7S2Y2_NEMVE|nr:predicted protein [Nematostella vectensis]|eukprot:XP_001633969.1 predicted protein [Nematostella vectensis]